MLSLVALSSQLSAAATDVERHYHGGRLSKYRLGKPKLLLSSADEERLQEGQAVMQAVAADDGSRRMIMVQDIDAPVHVVMGRIVDLERYDQMVQGVDSCVNYVSTEQDGIKTLKSKYEIHAAHMKLTYYMEHTYDPAQNCMVFNLDYDRRSDLDDSVGYWFAQPTGPASCRVFYSCECKLRGWVPGPVYNVLTKKALKQATTWVSTEALKEWRLVQRGSSPNERLARFVSNVRSSVDRSLVGLRSPPELRQNLLSTGRRAVRFVSALSQPKNAVPLI